MGDCMNINLGISEENRKKIVEHLSKFLADTYVLYLKTQNFHWNVEGAMFVQLHSIFEEQYKALAEAADVIAERIRALGFYAPASFSQYANLASLQEVTRVPTDKEMITQLLEDQELLARSIRASLSFIESAQDQATVDMLIQRMTAHEKNAWMLRSLLK
jgi:starvation-inducible DNA-binding protein